MSEVITPRLMAAAKEFNIGTNTLIEFLVSKNFNADELKPSTKLSEDMYRVLQSEFQQDKAAKQKAEQVDLPKGAGGDPKKKRDEEDLSIKKKDEKPKAAAVLEEVKPEIIETVVVETPVVESPKVDIPLVELPTAEIPVVEQSATQNEHQITKIVAPEIEGLKILDKIDLNQIDSSSRPKKGTKKEVAKKTSKTDETPKIAETPTPQDQEATITQVEAVVDATPIKEEPTLAVIENIQADKLTGPKILGKIVLPVNNDTRPKRETNEEKQKRKRIPIQKKPGDTTSQPGQPNRGNKALPDTRGGQPNRPPFGQQGGNPQQGGNRFQRPSTGGAGAAPKRQEDKIIDAKEIQEKLKQTQAKLAGAGGRGKSLKAKYRKAKREEMAENMADGEISNKLQVTEFISVSELAGLMDVSFADIISKCMNLGIMVSINQRLEADVIELVASEFNYEVEFIGVDDAAELEVDE